MSAATQVAPLTPERTRRMHLALLKQADETDLPPGADGRDRVRAFVDAVAAAGKMLEGVEERRAAQGILDYWVACLNMSPLGTEAAAPVGARLDAFDPPTVEIMLAKLNALPTEKVAIAVPLLSALVGPDDRDQMRAVAVSRERWLSGDENGLDACVATVAQHLLDLGIVVQSAGPEPSVELVSGALIHRWAPLSDAVRARATLRERARLWERAGKADPTIFATAPSGARRSLVVRDEFERSYAEFRDRLVDRRRRVLLGLALLAAMVLLFLAGAWQYQRQQAETAMLQSEKLATELEKAEAEKDRDLANSRLEPILQAIAIRDATALLRAVRDAGLTVSDDALTFRSPDPVSVGPNRVNSVVSLPPDNDVCRGAIWIGADGRSYLRDAPALGSEWTGRSFVTTANLRLRRGTPDPVRGQPGGIGIIPAGTTVVAQGPPVQDPTVRTPVWFVPITTAGPNCTVVYFQYAGTPEQARALSQTLDNIGYTMRAPEEVRLAPGLAEVRYFYPEDLDRSRGLARRAREALNRAGLLPGRDIAVHDLTGWPRAKPPPGTVELWLDLSGSAPSK